MVTEIICTGTFFLPICFKPLNIINVVCHSYYFHSIFVSNKSQLFSLGICVHFYPSALSTEHKPGTHSHHNIPLEAVFLRLSSPKPIMVSRIVLVTHTAPVPSQHSIYANKFSRLF
jgi:hypothetical protein